uniref:WD repeat domain 88 n=1 Tax=Oncorhynchus kisutch TaxID=8019 RepID=A0A8C7K5A2_ONCKI
PRPIGLWSRVVHSVGNRVPLGPHIVCLLLKDTESGAALLVFERGHLSNISECALIPDKKRLITASWDKTLNAWDLETGKIIWTAAQAGLLTSCSVSEDGKYVVSSSDLENAICLTSADTGERLFHIKDHHKSTITRCRFDPQSQHVASVSEDRTIKLWDLVSTQTTLSINSTHTNVISNCCFTANGRYLCTASWDKTLQLWDVQTGTFRSHGGLTLSKGHDGSVSSCTFSVDGSVLVSGAYDRLTVVLCCCPGSVLVSGAYDRLTVVLCCCPGSVLVSGAYDRLTVVLCCCPGSVLVSGAYDRLTVVLCCCPGSVLVSGAYDRLTVVLCCCPGSVLSSLTTTDRLTVVLCCCPGSVLCL